MSFSPGDVFEIEIEALGARGDGIAHSGGTRLFVPFAAPGDRLRVRIEHLEREGARAVIVARLAEGPGRAPPVCRHFGVCGGCVAQHLDGATYAAWKTATVRDSLVHRGLDVAVVRPLHRIAPATRRRARLKARCGADGVVLGFFAPESHRVVDLAECPVLAPPLEALLPVLRDALARLLAPGGALEIALTAADSGVDATFALARPPGQPFRAAVAAFAEAADLARVSFRRTAGRGDADPPEPLVQRRPVQMRFGAVMADLPPDAFLQPTEAGERFLADNVLAAVGKAKRVADLYAGCGAFALRLLAEGKRVLAVESAADHAQALEAAARRAGFGAQAAVEKRDLERRPLAGDELGRLDAVVLDPPRPGAAAQARMLGPSPVPVVVYVSCNPASFARDARTLVDGGYLLESVQPLDQFVFSPHVELAGVFRKSRKPRR